MKKLLTTAAIAVGLMTTPVSAEEYWWEMGQSQQQCFIIPTTLAVILFNDPDLRDRGAAHEAMFRGVAGTMYVSAARQFVDLLFDSPEYANVTLVQAYLACDGFDQDDRDVILGMNRPQA